MYARSKTPCQDLELRALAPARSAGGVEKETVMEETMEGPALRAGRNKVVKVAAKEKTLKKSPNRNRNFDHTNRGTFSTASHKTGGIAPC
jgi:hypothetical protein